MKNKINVFVNNLSRHQFFLKLKDLACQFFKERNYQEIDLPLLSPSLLPESYLEIFKTEFIYFSKKKDYYLIPSPELFLKRLLVEGIGNCYYLGKAFRNSEPLTTLHSPEFTILEFYKKDADYLDLADEVLLLLRYLARCLYQKEEFIFKNQKISLKEWEKLSVSECFYQFAQIEEKELFDKKLFLKKAKEKGYNVNKFCYEEIWSQIYTQEIEPNLGTRNKPTLIYDYPKEFAALARLNNDGKTAQRFEFYIGQVELGDGYSELQDPIEQEKRFKKESEKRKQQNKIPHKVDFEFIDFLKKGLPKCAGVAIGFDRLVMVLGNFSTISDFQLINVF